MTLEQQSETKKSVHTGYILHACRSALSIPNHAACCWCQVGLLFLPWSTIHHDDVAKLESRMIDRSYLPRRFRRPVEEISLAAKRQVAADFIVGNLPFEHPDVTLLLLLQVANVRCFHIESFPRNNCSRIVWIPLSHADDFQQYDRCCVLGDLNGVWVAQCDFGATVLHSVAVPSEMQVANCPRTAVTIARSTRRRPRHPKPDGSNGTTSSDGSGES